MFTSEEGDEATSPSFVAENAAIDASSSSLEALIATRYMQGDAMEALYRRQTDTCLPIFKCLQAERATRQRRPLLQLKTKQLMLPARCWKRSLQLGTCKWDAMEALYRRQTKICLPIFNCLQVERATRQRHPFVQLKTKHMMLPACRWKRSVQHRECRLHGNGSTLPMCDSCCNGLVVLMGRLD